jgi:hypothetical protein
MGAPVRRALNDNPVAQIGILAVLALLVGFLLITQMSHKSSETSTTATTGDASAASVAGPATPSGRSSGPPSSVGTQDTASSAQAGDLAPATGGLAAGEFVPGPGLPGTVVKAYEANRVVVVLVVRRNGIDDEAVKRSVEGVAGSGNVALFVANAGHIARYSRIASGVDVDRVPALIVLRPRKLSHGTPTAMVSYGFRGPESVAQAIHDATYKGPTDQPYYPR